MAKVFLDYDQAALDAAYDQAAYAPNRDQILARFAHASELTRRRLGTPERFAYGKSAIEALDVYRAKKAEAPVLVYVHGGAWRTGMARDYAFPAEMALNAGAHYAVLDFNNVLETNGDLMPMAEQVQRGIAWAAEHISPTVYVCGTSSGAHLAAVAATKSLPVKGYVLGSGMYDLRGPRLSKRSAYVKFTDEVEDALSPQRHLDRIKAPLTILYGSLETPEFQRQARDFADALTRAGKAAEIIRCEGYNHFELSETLGNPYGPLGRAVLAQMKLGS
jgi:arylformamidase